MDPKQLAKLVNELVDFKQKTLKKKDKDLKIEMSGMVFHLNIDDLPRFMNKMNDISSNMEANQNKSFH